MKLIKHCLYGAVSMLALLLVNSSTAQDSVLDNSKTLAVIPVAMGSVDQSVYRQVDLLVPELKRISNGNIFKLECRYSGKAEREQDVLKAYQIASRIEKYLRVKHGLGLDLWITVNLDSKQSKSPSVLTIALFAEDIKRLNSSPVAP